MSTFATFRVLATIAFVASVLAHIWGVFHPQAPVGPFIVIHFAVIIAFGGIFYLEWKAKSAREIGGGGNPKLGIAPILEAMGNRPGLALAGVVGIVGLAALGPYVLGNFYAAAAERGNPTVLGVSGHWILFSYGAMIYYFIAVPLFDLQRLHGRAANPEFQPPPSTNPDGADR
jgi:hypothetical protein